VPSGVPASPRVCADEQPAVAARHDVGA
jgi:hypothetical protein